MKILMFGHKTIPSCLGGVEMAVGELSKHMAQKGHEVICCGRGGKRGIWQGVRLVPMPVLGKAGMDAVISSFLAALFSAFCDADVVHIHAEGPAFWCWIPKLAGKRVVVTTHGLDWQREKWQGSLAQRYIHWGEKMAVRFADSIIVLSSNAQRYFRDTCSRETVRIPNGVSEAEPIPAVEITQQYGLEKDSYFLFLGRLVPEKGIHYLIEAFRDVSTEKKLVIAGGASGTEAYVDRLKEMAAGDDRIVFTGFADGILREELYSNAWVYVLPTDLEGMPLSLLEAMAYGNCCLTSDIPECTEVTGNAGLCFPKGNVAQLRNILEQLCCDPCMVVQCRERSKVWRKDQPGWDWVAERTLEQYR